MGGLKDLTGMRFGKLIVIERKGSNKYGRALWLCKCDCGNEKIQSSRDLLGGHATSCGCSKKERIKDLTFEDLIGQRFGRLIVIRQEGRTKNKQVKWLCKCDCGNEAVVTTSHLKLGHIKSCGCLLKETTIERNKKRIGENSPRWNSELTDKDREGRRKQQGYNEWSYKVKEKADFICNICGQKHGDIVSHHLESYNSNKNLRLDVNNGVCLCDKCHKEFHHIYGYGNNTKQQYIEFKENKLKEVINNE